LAELPARPLRHVAPFLLADEDDRAAVELADAGDHRAVVAAATVPVQLEPVVAELAAVVERVRPVGMARELDRAPDVVAGGLLPDAVELALQPLELARPLSAAEAGVVAAPAPAVAHG